MTDYTHEIGRIVRGSTKSNKPMWKCFTLSGDTVNVFEHELPERNTAGLLVDAGYAEFKQMASGDAQTWGIYPIRVQLVKDGQWWALAAVEPRPKHAEADANWTPDLQLYRDRAQRLSKRLTVSWDTEVVYWDSECTGTEQDDEMVAISIVRTNGQVLMDSLIQCANPKKLLRVGPSGISATEVNGITPDMLAAAQLVPDALNQITEHLINGVWVGWNINFDVALLEREYLRYNRPLPFATGIHDAMTIFAEYLGAWQPMYQRFRNVKLSEAARLLDLDPGQTHTAKADAMATLNVLRAVAVGMPIVDDVRE